MNVLINMRIAGVQLPVNKSVELTLQNFHGIGAYKSSRLFRKLGINQHKKAVLMTARQWTQLTALIEREPLLGGKLKRQKQEDINSLKAMSAYRGIRHTRNLPVRGQRTHTNAKTCRRRQSRTGSKKLYRIFLIRKYLL
jgi:small subunit ribosomal protein S13